MSPCVSFPVLMRPRCHRRFIPSKRAVVTYVHRTQRRRNNAQNFRLIRVKSDRELTTRVFACRLKIISFGGLPPGGTMWMCLKPSFLASSAIIPSASSTDVSRPSWKRSRMRWLTAFSQVNERIVAYVFAFSRCDEDFYTMWVRTKLTRPG